MYLYTLAKLLKLGELIKKEGIRNHLDSMQMSINSVQYDPFTDHGNKKLLKTAREDKNAVRLTDEKNDKGP